MNIEEWQKKYVNPDLLNKEFVILDSDFRDLLKTHAIVPREPSKSMVNAGSIAVGGCDFAVDDPEVVCYKAMIEAAENE